MPKSWSSGDGSRIVDFVVTLMTEGPSVSLLEGAAAQLPIAVDAAEMVRMEFVTHSRHTSSRDGLFAMMT